MSPDRREWPQYRASILLGLLDVKFERQVTPILIKWIYIGALVVTTFGVLFALLWVWSFAAWLGWAMWLAAPVVIGCGLVSLLSVRVLCERAMARFRQPWTVPPPSPPGPRPFAPTDNTDDHNYFER